MVNPLKTILLPYCLVKIAADLNDENKNGKHLRIRARSDLKDNLSQKLDLPKFNSSTSAHSGSTFFHFSFEVAPIESVLNFRDKRTKKGCTRKTLYFNETFGCGEGAIRTSRGSTRTFSIRDAIPDAETRNTSNKHNSGSREKAVATVVHQLNLNVR